MTSEMMRPIEKNYIVPFNCSKFFYEFDLNKKGKTNFLKEGIQ